MKHLRFLTISLLIAVVTVTPLVHAQTGDISGSGGAVYCRNGGRDYGNFLSAVISYDGFYEYWKDILVRYNANMCLFMDIDNLLTKLDKARDQIRQAFYVCSSTAPKLAKTYYDLEAELYFLRNYVDVDKGNILFKSDTAIGNAFIDYVVNERGFYTTRADAQVALDKFISKYAARQDTYINCADPTWGNLIAKWNEFKDNLGGFTAVQQAAESITKKWDSVVNTPFKRTGGLLGGLLDAKINGLDPATAWYDISNEISRNLPSAANTATPSQASASQQATYGFTFDQFQNAASGDAEWHDQILTRTQYLTQYQQLYQEGTSNISKEIIDRVTYLEGSIQNTYQYIDKTATCTKGIVEKTCP